MNNEDIRVKFTVTGFSAASRQTTTIGTYDCITAAEERVETWQNDSNKYPYVDELKIVKHSQVTVQTSTRSSSTPSTPVDYERQGVAMEGVKYDGKKPDMYLLPPLATLEVGKVLTYGANKYSPDNWKKLDSLQERYTSAAMRHLLAHMSGEENDEETDMSHLAHAICCLLFKLEDQLSVESKEEGLREPVIIEYTESDNPLESSYGWHETYYQEGSV
jgi:hypothetical protein